MKNKIYTPNAAVKIYNYKDRFGSFSEFYNQEKDDPNEVDEIILATHNLISVSTNKSKSSPVGSFEFRLAPTHNWIESITPGSWCIIYMGMTDQTKGAANLTSESKDSSESANSIELPKESIKMIGRIDSVRQSSSVGSDGAISTNFVVSGVDWGSIFQSYIYVNPMYRLNSDKQILGAVQQYKKLLFETKKDEPPKPRVFSSTSAIWGILNFWGERDARAEYMENTGPMKNMFSAKSTTDFRIPYEMAEYLGFYKDAQSDSNKEGTDINNRVVVNRLVDIIEMKSGILLAQDSYSGTNGLDEKSIDGFGVIQPSSVIGSNTMWQILIDNCNEPVNEMFCEMRFQKGSPKFTIYKRIKPFVINDKQHVMKDKYQVGDGRGGENNSVASLIDNYISYFQLLKLKEIDIEDIISISAGTNWRDKYNHVDVSVDLQRSGLGGIAGLGLVHHAETQFFDKRSIAREGCIPTSISLKYLPIDIAKQTSSDNPKQYAGNILNDTILAFKFLAKEWFFDTHRMVNGSISLMGSDDYIEVGQNILIPLKALSSSYNLTEATLKNKEKSYLLAHVESVSHSVSVDYTGARHFSTNIQFVRGIISEQNPTVRTKDMLLDQEVDKVPFSFAKNNNMVVTPSRPSPLKGDRSGSKPTREGDT